MKKTKKAHRATNQPFSQWPDSPIKRLVIRELRNLANDFDGILDRYASEGDSDMARFIQERDQVFKQEIEILMAQRGIFAKKENND